MTHMLADARKETRCQRAADGMEFVQVTAATRAKNRRQLIAEAAWAAYASVQQNHGAAYRGAMNPYEDERQRHSFERTYRHRLERERPTYEK